MAIDKPSIEYCLDDKSVVDFCEREARSHRHFAGRMVLATGLAIGVAALTHVYHFRNSKEPAIVSRHLQAENALTYLSNMKKEVEQGHTKRYIPEGIEERLRNSFFEPSKEELEQAMLYVKRDIHTIETTPEFQGYQNHLETARHNNRRSWLAVLCGYLLTSALIIRKR